MACSPGSAPTPGPRPRTHQGLSGPCPPSLPPPPPGTIPPPPTAPQPPPPRRHRKTRSVTSPGSLYYCAIKDADLRSYSGTLSKHISHPERSEGSTIPSRSLLVNQILRCASIKWPDRAILSDLDASTRCFA